VAEGLDGAHRRRAGSSALKHTPDLRLLVSDVPRLIGYKPRSRRSSVWIQGRRKWFTRADAPPTRYGLQVNPWNDTAAKDIKGLLFKCGARRSVGHSAGLGCRSGKTLHAARKATVRSARRLDLGRTANASRREGKKKNYGCPQFIRAEADSEAKQGGNEFLPHRSRPDTYAALMGADHRLEAEYTAIHVLSASRWKPVRRHCPSRTLRVEPVWKHAAEPTMAIADPCDVAAAPFLRCLPQDRSSRYQWLTYTV